MRLNKEQLLDAARKAAKYLPAASADLMNELDNRLDVTSVALSESMEHRKELVVDNNFLLGLAARELNTSWLHSRAMLGMQAAVLCLSQGDIKAARDWLEGTTDEAVAEMPDDMTPDGLQLWYDSYMRSQDGKTGFLTREEALAKLKKLIPVTSVAIDELKATLVPDGWKLIPEQIHIDADGIEAICSQCGDGGDNYGEFTAGIVWVGEVSIDGEFKYGLNISSAEYPEEGAINIAEFELPEQSAGATSNG